MKGELKDHDGALEHCPQPVEFHEGRIERTRRTFYVLVHQLNLMKGELKGPSASTSANGVSRRNLMKGELKDVYSAANGGGQALQNLMKGELKVAQVGRQVRTTQGLESHEGRIERTLTRRSFVIFIHLRQVHVGTSREEN